MNMRFEGIMEVVKNERTYRFYMPVGASFPECKEACLEVLQAIDEFIKRAEEAQEQKSESKEE